MKWNEIAAIIIGVLGILLALYVILVPPANSQQNTHWFKQTSSNWIVIGDSNFCSINNKFDNGFISFGQDLTDESKELFLAYHNFKFSLPSIEEIQTGIFGFRTKKELKSFPALFLISTDNLAIFRFLKRDDVFKQMSSSEKMFIGLFTSLPIVVFDLKGASKAIKDFNKCIEKGKLLRKDKPSIAAKWQSA